ncbi:uncharacterized protein [Physcomitrium patens]|uniref:uncharacterized protein isoform X2 n=1 Tax=Physcomitrium patens TaxID=3218 RepID=UPI000D1558C5|nr:probable serine/threonine-protein kinase abkC isoform X2 [Physcomitrium patens]|eukprot:XP_024367568.1 probable serine/threonine-protein kinase abkC isoform X2 [Physcomitrella patens]
MRILPVFKLDQILRSSRSRDRGRSGFDDVAGAFLRSFWSVNYRKKLPDSNGRAYSLVSDAYAGCAQAQAWVTFSVSRRKIFGTVAGTNPSQVMRQEGSWSMFQAWKLWRSNILYRGSRESSYRECHPSIYWRPAIFVSLADRKGQVFLQSLALFVAGAWYQQYKAPSAAEQLHGNWELTSQTHDSSIVSVIKETVEAVLLWCRVVFLVALFTPALLVGAFVSDADGPLRRFWLHILLRSLEAAGPAFIKWGQWASTRPDIFPADICDELSRLHMQAPKHTFAETKKILLKAFRVPIEALFEEFEEEPVASGSIAQIYRAILRKPLGNGPPLVVAVKVRHPKVHELMQKDFVIIRHLAALSTVLPGLKHLQLDKTVQHFAAFMTKQVDLTLEAAHLQRFIYNFRKSKDVSFPTPIYPLVHPTVLVEQDNFIHGDLHPGNIFVRFVNNIPKVVLLDVGMTAELNAHSRAVMLGLFKAIAAKNGRDVAHYTLQFSEDQTCPDPEAFKKAVDDKFNEYLSIRGTAKNTGECMTELFDQVRQHRVNMDGDVCTVMVTTLILEGWQRKLDPDLDLFKMMGELLSEAEDAVPFYYTISAIAAP